MKFWAIIDKGKFCYATAKKTKGAMAIYDKKPVIAKKWKPFKEVIEVRILMLRND